MRPTGDSRNIEWSTWIIDNLIRGVSTAQITKALSATGISPSIAKEWIQQLAHHQTVQQSLQSTRPLRQSDLYLRLRRKLNQIKAVPNQIRELKSINGDVFFNDFYFENRPVVLRGYANTWSALKKWTLEHLTKTYGHVEVSITDDRLTNPNYDMEHQKHTRQILLSDFIQQVSKNESGNNAYMVANNRVIERPEMSSLIDDVHYDPELFDAQKWRGSSAFWLGPEGTVTPLHHDTCNILFVQVQGRKVFRLFSPLELDLLTHARSMYADIDPEAPDHDRHPNFSSVGAYQTTLNPGDAIFLPIGWWHHVRALDISISFAMTNFVVPNNFDWYRPGEVI